MKHVAVSVRARLLNYSKQSGIPFQNLLDEFALGRFLWRLSRSRFQREHGPPDEQTQWASFLRKSRLTADPLPVIIGRLHGFLHPVLFPNGENSAMKWSPAAGWHIQS